MLQRKKSHNGFENFYTLLKAKYIRRFYRHLSIFARFSNRRVVLRRLTQRKKHW